MMRPVFSSGYVSQYVAGMESNVALIADLLSSGLCPSAIYSATLSNFDNGDAMVDPINNGFVQFDIHVVEIDGIVITRCGYFYYPLGVSGGVSEDGVISACTNNVVDPAYSVETANMVNTGCD